MQLPGVISALSALVLLAPFLFLPNSGPICPLGAVCSDNPDDIRHSTLDLRGSLATESSSRDSQKGRHLGGSGSTWLEPVSDFRTGLEGPRRSLLEERPGQQETGAAGGATGAAEGGERGQAWEDRLVICITPTYPRAFQALYFNNLVAALRAAGPNILWLVIEGPNKTEETSRLLEITADRCLPLGDPNCRRVNYVHLTTYKNESARWNKAVIQRNAGLEYIQEKRIKGTVYFMDDDNTYSPLLFDELRKVQHVGVFPVGFLFSLEFGIRNPYIQHHPTVERPLVRPRLDGKGGVEVYGWETFEWSIPKTHGGAPRSYCTDMAGFAFSSELLWSQLPHIPTYPKQPVRFVPVSGGYLETTFLGRLVPGIHELEPLANEAREVLVWHTHAEAEKHYPYPQFWKLPQPSAEDLVKITAEGTTWGYVIGEERYGIKGMRHTDLRPGYIAGRQPAPKKL